jgi:hydroxypyruvate isomerase
VNRATGLQNCRFLAALDHLTVNGEDLEAVLATQVSLIGHVQIVDAPGRGESGTGTIDFATHLDSLTRAVYRGRVGLEYKTTDTSASRFGWLDPFAR